MNSEKVLREALERIKSIILHGESAQEVRQKSGPIFKALAKPSPAPVEREGEVTQADRDVLWPLRMYICSADPGEDVWNAGGYDDHPFMLAFAAHRLAALAPEPVREGWKLVPIEPTDAMLKPLSGGYISLDFLRAHWPTMLAAAPLSAREGE